MDIQIASPLLVANVLRCLAEKAATRGGKAYFAAFAFILLASGIASFYGFQPFKQGADLDGDYPAPGPVIFQDSYLAQVSNPFTDSYIALGVNSGFPEADKSGFELVRKMNVVVTAYSSTPWETDGTPYVTASGAWVEEGIVAINSLPFGTRVRIPEVFGDKVFVVEDRLHRRKGNYHVDVWFPSYKDALDFGAKRTYIEVLEG